MLADADIHRVEVADGQTMAVRDLGQGPPILLVHGIPGSAAIWDAVATRLAARHRVLVPDLLGFGASTRSRDLDTLGPAGQARALTTALDALDLPRVAWAGHDYGAMLALEVARTRPERISHLALAATNAFPDTPVPFPLSTTTWPLLGDLFARLVFSGPSLSMTLRMGTAVPGCRLDPAAYLGDADQTAAIGTIFAAALRHLRAWYAPIEASLATVAVPTAVIWGDRDPFFTPAQGERTAAAIPGARFVLLERTGHFLPSERPTELADTIAQLLDETEPATGSAPR